MLKLLIYAFIVIGKKTCWGKTNCNYGTCLRGFYYVSSRTEHDFSGVFLRFE